jgi:hypothetical protein
MKEKFEENNIEIFIKKTIIEKDITFYNIKKIIDIDGKNCD